MANSRKSKFNLQQRVAEALAPVVPQGSSLLLGLSGGVDSVVLLHMLAHLTSKYSWRINAMHVHHGISQHADEWADFCTRLCAGYSIPLTVERVDISPLREMGIEAAARKLRHEALERMPADFIVLAHHRDDQVETLLLQLLRGAGVRGASGMAMLKSRKNLPALLRPLRDVERQALEAYAREHGLKWVEDDSNKDVGYPRNFLRHEVLPVLSRRFPTYRTTLARSSQHFAEATALLDELALQDSTCAVSDGLLDVLSLRQLSKARAKNLLRHFLAASGAPIPNSSRLEEMLHQLCVASEGAQIRITWQNWQLRCYRGKACALPVLLPAENFTFIWQGEAEVSLPGSHGVLHFERAIGQGLSLSKLKHDRVSIRPRHGSESIKLDIARPRQSLRNLLQQQGVPPWNRELLPLLYCGNELVHAPGVASAAEYLAQGSEEGVLLRWKRK